MDRHRPSLLSTRLVSPAHQGSLWNPSLHVAPWPKPTFASHAPLTPAPAPSLAACLAPPLPLGAKPLHPASFRPPLLAPVGVICLRPVAVPPPPSSAAAGASARGGAACPPAPPSSGPCTTRTTCPINGTHDDISSSNLLMLVIKLGKYSSLFEGTFDRFRSRIASSCVIVPHLLAACMVAPITWRNTPACLPSSPGPRARRAAPPPPDTHNKAYRNQPLSWPQRIQSHKAYTVQPL